MQISNALVNANGMFKNNLVDSILNILETIQNLYKTRD